MHVIYSLLRMTFRFYMKCELVKNLFSTLYKYNIILSKMQLFEQIKANYLLELSNIIT